MKPRHKKSPEELDMLRRARQLGLNIYIGGECQECHHPDKLWYTARGQCVECTKKAGMESKLRNKGDNIEYRDCQCNKCGDNRWYKVANKCVGCYEKIVSKRLAAKRDAVAARAEKVITDADSIAMILAKPWGYWSSSQVSTTV